MKKMTSYVSTPKGEVPAILDSCILKAPLAIICHPHPVHGGNMENKVVTTLSKVCKELGFSCVRFNYRSTQDPMLFSGGIEETEDALAVAAWASDMCEASDLLFLGFSFGAFVAFECTFVSSRSMMGLILIAPPINRFAFRNIQEVSCPWYVLIGEKDEIVPSTDVEKWVGYSQNSSCIYESIKEVGHFFHGSLHLLRMHVISYVRQIIS